MATNAPLTDPFCDQATGPLDRPYVIHYDPKTRGFGLRVTKAGAKSFTLDYRIGRLQRRYTIGTFRDPWTVAGARRRALDLKKLIDTGHDPQAERNLARSAPTLNDLIEIWRQEHAPTNRPRTRKENEALIKQWLRPSFGTQPVEEIRRVDIRALHRKITFAIGTAHRANRVLALLSKMFSIAVEHEMRSDNPCRGIERNVEEGRTRYLTLDELARLSAALIAHGDLQGAHIIRFLLLTGCRSAEALTATWNQFDLSMGRWTKPSAHTKQKRVHSVPLSAPALQLLALIRSEEVPSPYVFPNRQGDGHRKGIRWNWDRLCQAASLQGVRIHDLRHTYASYLASSGLSLPVIGSLLGHTTPAMTNRYSHLLDNPLREATEQFGAIFSAAVDVRAEIVSLDTYRRPPSKRQGARVGGTGA